MTDRAANYMVVLTVKTFRKYSNFHDEQLFLEQTTHTLLIVGFSSFVLLIHIAVVEGLQYVFAVCKFESLPKDCCWQLKCYLLFASPSTSMNNGSLVYKVYYSCHQMQYQGKNLVSVYTTNKIALMESSSSPFQKAFFERMRCFIQKIFSVFFVTRYAVKNFTRLSLLGLLMYYIYPEHQLLSPQKMLDRKSIIDEIAS